MGKLIKVALATTALVASFGLGVFTKAKYPRPFLPQPIPQTDQTSVEATIVTSDQNRLTVELPDGKQETYSDLPEVWLLGKQSQEPSKTDASQLKAGRKALLAFDKQRQLLSILVYEQ